MMTLYKWVYSRRMIDLDNLSVDDITVDDIAHSLSSQCRFNGHTDIFYSVAEHCIAVSNMLPDEYKLWGLLHDAGEAYIGDVFSDLKKRNISFQVTENSILKVIAEKFGLVWPMPELIKKVDVRMLLTEARDLLGVHDFSRWGVGETKPYRKDIYTLSATLYCRHSMSLVEWKYKSVLESLTKG